jgi:hypothetical protein
MTRTYKVAASGSITSQVIALRRRGRNRAGTRRLEEVTMSTTAISPDTTNDRRALLRDAIRLDAVVTGAAGVLLAAGAPVLDGVLGVRPAVLGALGLFLIGYAVALLVLARAGAPATWVKAVIAANVLWVAASVVAVLADWLTLTAFGTACALVQAAAVALLAELQLIALRRSQ